MCDAVQRNGGDRQGYVARLRIVDDLVVHFHQPTQLFRHSVRLRQKLENLSGVNDMTLVDLVEMLADWKAATERHDDGDLAKSLEIQRERFGLSD